MRRLYGALLLVLLLVLLSPLAYTALRREARPAAPGKAPLASSRRASSGSIRAEATTGEESGGAASGQAARERAAPGGSPSPKHAPSPAPPESVGAPAPTRKESPAARTVAVAVAVVGKEGELIFGPGTVQVAETNPWGLTALGALDATGLDYTVSARFPGFVEAVAGEYNRGQSGWMYEVNGEVPLVSAAEKQIRPGDRVIWWYSSRLGEAPPRWEELVKLKEERAP